MCQPCLLLICCVTLSKSLKSLSFSFVYLLELLRESNKISRVVWGGQEGEWGGWVRGHKGMERGLDGEGNIVIEEG